jgi:hypothetical protein
MVWALVTEQAHAVTTSATLGGGGLLLPVKYPASDVGG